MIQGNCWALAENPKTATTSLRRALRDFQPDPEKHSAFWSQRIAPGKPHRAVVVRNPYDRVVSGWKYNTKEGTPLLEWLRGEPWEVGVGLDFKRCPQTCWAWRCNIVMRFERLEDDFAEFCDRFALGDRRLERLNAGAPRLHYRLLIDAESRALIEDRFAPDFARWGYRW